MQRMSDGRSAVLLLVVAAAMFSSACVAEARAVKLWPFVEYQSDETAGTLRVKLLGPLIEYSSDPEYLRLALRPLLSIRQARRGHDDEVRLLYPFMTSRWTEKEQTTIAAGGLLRYSTTTTADAKRLTSQHFSAFPLYFYDWQPGSAPRASLVPVYVDLENRFGYERVQMIGFPGYLRLDEPGIDRRYMLFPFFGTVRGPGATGKSVWPFYGRTTVGDTYDSGFVLWPFYVWDTRTDHSGTEERLLSFPFYAHLRGPEGETTAYGTIAYVHTLDLAEDEERWGFPWPFWVYEKSTVINQGTSLRLFPLYQSRREGPRFIDPFSLDRCAVADDVSSERSDPGDFLPILYRDEERGDLPGVERTHVRTLFPVYRGERADTNVAGNTLALFDALHPYDVAFRELYAPLWQMYAWDGSAETPRWSVAWGAVTHARGTTIYPWHFE